MGSSAWSSESLCLNFWKAVWYPITSAVGIWYVLKYGRYFNGLIYKLYFQLVHLLNVEWHIIYFDNVKKKNIIWHFSQSPKIYQRKQEPTDLDGRLKIWLLPKLFFYVCKHQFVKKKKRRGWLRESKESLNCNNLVKKTFIIIHLSIIYNAHSTVCIHCAYSVLLHANNAEEFEVDFQKQNTYLI